jgi:hypothetical protein
MARHQFITLMVFDRRDMQQLAVEAHVVSARPGAETHKLLLDWDACLPSIVSYPAGDCWTAATEVLLEVASRAAQMRVAALEPDLWGRVMLRVPGALEGPVREYVIEMHPTGDASFWLRGDAMAERFWLPVPECRAELDCASALALVLGELLEQCPQLVGRASACVGRKPA